MVLFFWWWRYMMTMMLRLQQCSFMIVVEWDHHHHLHRRWRRHLLNKMDGSTQLNTLNSFENIWTISMMTTTMMKIRMAMVCMLVGTLHARAFYSAKHFLLSSLQKFFSSTVFICFMTWAMMWPIDVKNWHRHYDEWCSDEGVTCWCERQSTAGHWLRRWLQRIITHN